MQRWLDGYAASRSPQTVEHARAVLRAALNYALDQELVSRNVAQRVTVPRRKQHLLEPLSAEELRRLIALLERDPLRPLYLTAMTLRLRQSACVALRWADVDLERGWLRVERRGHYVDGTYDEAPPKSAASRREIAIPPALVEELREHRRRQNERRLRLGPRWRDRDLVFANATGRPLYGPHMTRHLQRQAERAGMRRITFHGLRHSAAAHMLASGASIKEVADSLGHSDISLTANTYTRLIEESKSAIAARMDVTVRQWLTGTGSKRDQ